MVNVWGGRGEVNIVGFLVGSDTIQKQPISLNSIMVGGGMVKPTLSSENCPLLRLPPTTDENDLIK